MNRSVIAMVVVVGLVASVSAIVWQCRSPYEPRQLPDVEWFYDLNSQKLFTARAGEIPPLAAPSGPLPDGSPAGVRAYVYGCRDCSEANRFIAYLETYTPNARREMETMRQPWQGSMPPMGFGDAAVGKGVLVCTPQDPSWLEGSSPEGMAIVAGALSHRCPAGVTARQCYPGR